MSISSTAGGNYLKALTTTSTATVNVTDDADTTVVTLTASAASVTEGGSVVLPPPAWNNAVTGSDLVVTLSSSADHDPGGQLERQQRAGER